jgi:nitroreductase
MTHTCVRTYQDRPIEDEKVEKMLQAAMAAPTAGNKNKMNSMTIGWGGLGVLWGRERPVVTVYVEERRYTHSFMEENEYFTVESFGPEQQKVLECKKLYDAPFNPEGFGELAKEEYSKLRSTRSISVRL